MFEWMRQPEDRIAGVVPVDLELAASETVVMAMTHIAAFPQGFGFHFDTVTSVDVGEVCASSIEDGEGNDLALLFGVEFADGRRADGGTNWIMRDGEDHFGLPAMPKRLPPDPDLEVFISAGGVASYDRRFAGSCWVWPLPPPGPLTFWTGWPAAGLPVRPTRIDAELVLAAVSASRRLWGSE